MSLETLLEAARFVEQQDLVKQQFQSQQSLSPVAPGLEGPQGLAGVTGGIGGITNGGGGLKIVSPVPLISAVSPQPQLSQSPPAALVAMQHMKVSPANNTQPGIGGTAIITSRSPRPPPNTVTCLQSPVVEMITKSVQLPSITNGYDNSNHITTTTIKLEEITSQEGILKPSKMRSNSISQSVHAPSSCVMRSGTREVHNKLEKNRRAHLKECFELLKKQLPPQQDEKKSSNLSILHSALKYIQVLKKHERENEHEMERLAREKIAAQQRLASLKKELGAQWDALELNGLLVDAGGASSLTTTAIATTVTASTATLSSSASSSLPVPIFTKEETIEEEVTVTQSQGVTQLSVVPITAGVSYQPVNVSPGLVLGLHKVALVSRPVTHIIAASTPTQQPLNAKMVPLVNTQYVMKPVVVVSTPSAPSQS